MKPAVDEIPYTAFIEGVKVGKIIGISGNKSIYVDFKGNNNRNLSARFVKSIDWRNLKYVAKNALDVLLVFENGDPARPIIIDILSPMPQTSIEDEPQDVCIDGKHIAFNAKEQITLKCGKSSITLTSSGKVLVKGDYVLNRSSGPLRLKGASVQIN